MEADIDNLEDLLSQLDEELAPWVQEIDTNAEKHGHKAFSKSFNEKGPVVKSQISASFAFVLQTLYFSLLKLNNVDTENHQINEEIDRIRKLYIKIDKAINPEKYENKPKKDVDATKRIISSVLSANNFIQKQEDESKKNAREKSKKKRSSKKSKIESLKETTEEAKEGKAN